MADGGLLQSNAGCQEEIPAARKKGAVFLQGMSSWEKFCSSEWTSTVAKVLPPVSPVLSPASPLSPMLQPPGAAALPLGTPQPWKPHGIWLREGSFAIRLVTKEGVHSLPCESHNRLWAGVHTGPQHRSLSPTPSCHPYFFLMCIPSLPPHYSQAAQTAARYYSVVAWIPLNTCQSAQRAESELFKLHLLKDPWCLFLLFVFSNSLKS